MSDNKPMTEERCKCPECGGLLFCTYVGIMLHEKCSNEYCDHLVRYNNRRKQQIGNLPFADRRKNDD